MQNKLLRTNLAGLELRTPVILASGVVGYAIEYERLKDIDFDMIGGIVLKGVNLKGKKGNIEPRIIDSTIGVINSIGLENPGVIKLIDKILPRIPQKTCLIANIFGDTVQEYGQVAKKLNSINEIHAIEINISCPNVKRGGQSFGSDPIITREVINTVKSNYTRGPIIAKLPPSVSDITAIAKGAIDGGADIISLINTMPSMAVNINVTPPRSILGNDFGGLSGPAIKPIGLAKVCQTYQFIQNIGINIPIIGIGGIMTSSDAIEYMAVGSAAVQIGTIMFSNVNAYKNITKGIEKYLNKHHFSSIKDSRLIGSIKMNSLG